MSKSKTRAVADWLKENRPKWNKWVLGAVGTVLIAVLASVATTFVGRLMSDADAKNQPPVDVTVVDNSVCNFVAPLSGVLVKDPAKLKVRPAEIGQGSACDKTLRKVHGARTDMALEAVLAPSGDAGIVLTDITIHLRKSSPVGDSAFFSPAGTGGGGETLSLGADVEDKTAVREVDVYAEDGSMKTFATVLSVRPRPTATKADPLTLDLHLYGEKKYTNFDVDLHWQSSTGSDSYRLDNGGAGYTVGGSDGLPSFRGTDGDRWELGTN